MNGFGALRRGDYAMAAGEKKPMIKVRPSALLKGIVSYVPGAGRLVCARSGGTDSARYCYSVWMRHLVKGYENGLLRDPKAIIELGPGDSFGIGLCAMLCGADVYYAFDAKPHARASNNDRIVEELLDLLIRKESIPSEAEFPYLAPRLESYDFPSHILTETTLEKSLQKDRVVAIRRCLRGSHQGEIQLQYCAPWHTGTAHVAKGRVDLAFSQAVMEHVENVEEVYSALYHWLKPGGVMSHTIDYTAHEYAYGWNGHWTIPDPIWTIVRGRRPYLLNRLSHSQHVRAISDAGFQVAGEWKRNGSGLNQDAVARRFRNLPCEDLSIRGAFIQAIKPTSAAT